jgi:hypothetical protein
MKLRSYKMIEIVFLLMLVAFSVVFYLGVRKIAL